MYAVSGGLPGTRSWFNKTISKKPQKVHDMKKTHKQSGTNRSSPIPHVIPPESIVEIAQADDKTPAWKHMIGTRYRVGYYSRQDGLDCIWLVDDQGNYVETTDRDFLIKYFKIVHLSSIDDYFGENRHPIGPMPETGESEH